MQAWSTVSHEKPTGQCRYPHSGRGVRARNGPPSRVERYVPHSLRRARGSERRSAADTGGCTTCPARTRRRMRARQPRPRRPRRRRGRQSSTRRRAACRRFGSRRCRPSPSRPRSWPSGSPVVPTNPARDRLGRSWVPGTQQVPERVPRGLAPCGSHSAAVYPAHGLLGAGSMRAERARHRPIDEASRP